MRVVFSVIIGAAMVCLVWSRAEDETGLWNSKNHPRYQPYIAGYILPFFLTGLYLVGLIVLGRDSTNHLVLSTCLSVFWRISLYYAILLPLLPWLRRRISASTCAMLWIIPNYLYLLERDFLYPSAPLLVITAPGKLALVLISIWFAGFVVVLVWKIASHLRFRHLLLNNAADCPIQVRQQWKTALTNARFKNTDIPLLVSPYISTPLTVGLFRYATVVVLPRKAYTQEELDLIFHHEIVHIGRLDAWNKFFSVFCTAMCWFNPLMWMAMAKSAQDLELSCDETVLLNADEDTRKRYASLLLNTAGDSRGFTTCLSASAQALRHRLRSIVNPEDRSTGATVAGVAFCLLALTGGFVAMAYDEVSFTEILAQPASQSAYVLTVMDYDCAPTEEDLTLADTDGILEYFSDLTVYRLTGQYSFTASNRNALFRLHLPGVKTYWVYVYDNAIELYPLGEEPLRPILYYIPDGIDWDHLDTLLPTA